MASLFKLKPASACPLYSQFMENKNKAKLRVSCAKIRGNMVKWLSLGWLKCAYCRARRVRVAALAVGFYANNESSFLWCGLHVVGSQVYGFIRPPSGRCEQTCSRHVVTTITLINFHNIKCTKGTEQWRERKGCSGQGPCEKMSSD